MLSEGRDSSMKELGERYTADSAPQSNRIDNVLFKVPARLSDSLDWPLGPGNKEWHVQHIICQNWFAKSHKTKTHEIDVGQQSRFQR